MKKYINSIVSVFFIFFSIVFLQAGKGSSKACFSNGKGNIGGTLVSLINKAEKEVRVVSPQISYVPIFEALGDSGDRGVDTKLYVSDRPKSNRVKAQLRKVKKKGVQVYEVEGLHAKGTLTDKKITWGSENMSDKSQSGNKEIMVRTKDDEGYLKQSRALFDSLEACNSPKSSKKRKHNSPQPSKERKIVKITPEGRKVFGSREHHLNKSKARRVLKFVEEQVSENTEEKDFENFLYFTSMTFDNEDFVESIEEVLKKCSKENRPNVKCMFDKSALKHLDLLDRIKIARKDHIRIYILDGSFNLQHRKTMVRFLNGEWLGIISTGNLANQSDMDFNVDSYHKGDEKLCKQICEEFDKLIPECTEYTGS